jgi:hypothetical protein
VAADRTLSGTITALAADASAALAPGDAARAGARGRVWALVAENTP